MSHITTVATEIRDREVLVQALEQLGVAWAENRWVHGHEGSIRMDILIGNELRAGMGFGRAGPDLAYVVHSWGRGWGGNSSRRDRILQEYARLKVLKEARRRNYGLVEQTRCSGNRIRLVLRKAAG